MRRYHRKPPQPPKAKTASRRPKIDWFDNVLGALCGLIAVLIGCRLLLAALAAMPAIAAVGDRIPVSPATVPIGLMAPKVIAHSVANPAAAPGAACRLDLAVMEHPGGVFSVLAVRPDGVVISWAGGPTSRHGGACDTAHGGVLVAPGDYSLLLKRQTAKH